MSSSVKIDCNVNETKEFNLEIESNLMSENSRNALSKLSISLFPKAIFVFCCITMVLYQISRVVQIYVNFPTIVDVTVKEPQELVEALPSITVCDSNTIQLSKLIETFPKLQMNLDKAKNKFEKAQVLQKYKETHLAENETLIRTLLTFGTAAERFIEYLNCDEEKWKKPNEITEPCENIPIIRSFHYNAMCFILFHQVSTTWKIGETLKTTLKKNPKNVEPVVVRDDEKQFSVEQFAPNEVIQLMLNFQPNESTNLYKAVGGSLFISNTRDIPGMESIKHSVEPGHYYEFYMRRSSTHQLPAPFDTNCTAYFDENKHWIETHRKLSKPLSRLSCYQLCLVNEVIKCRNKAPLLWPPEVPYHEKNAFEQLDVTWGLWLQEDGSKKHKYMKTMCTQFAKPHCKQKCPQDCHQEHYNVVVQKQKWPFTEITETTTTKEMNEMKRLSSCCAFISVRYSTFLRTIHRHNAHYKPLELLSQIGGLMSMWIGVSVLSLWDIVAFVIRKLHH